MAARRFCIALLVAAAACSDKTQQPPPNPPPPTPDAATGPMSMASLHFGTTEADVLSGAPEPMSYDVLQINDLWFAYAIGSIPDVVVMRTETFMPDGSLFTSYISAYSFDPAAHPQVIPQGYSLPVDVRIAHRGANNSVELTYGIAISGTDYVRHATPGVWKVKVSLDGVDGSEVTGTVMLKVGP